jgi:arylsulfatase A-like enzyme
VKVSYPPNLSGRSLLPAVLGRELPLATRLYGQNDRNLVATWDRRFKLVATPKGDGWRFALYDRATDPAETRDASSRRADELQTRRRELELFLERLDGEWSRLRGALSQTSGEEPMTRNECENLKALGYIGADQRCPGK